MAGAAAEVEQIGLQCLIRDALIGAYLIDSRPQESLVVNGFACGYWLNATVRLLSALAPSSETMLD